MIDFMRNYLFGFTRTFLKKFEGEIDLLIGIPYNFGLEGLLVKSMHPSMRT